MRRNGKIEFQEFYNAYPRKTAKAHAQLMWNRLTEEEKQLAIDAIPMHVKYWESTGTAKQHIPHPGTWLNPVNGRRWEDELEMPIPKPKGATVAWWQSDELIIAKGQELGISPRPGETMAQFKSRVADKLRVAA